jgi:hypothetical protein
MFRTLLIACTLVACAPFASQNLDPGDDTTDAGLPPDDGSPPYMPDAAELPESINGVPLYLVPFPCGQVWEGQTRTDHSPPLAVDFNRLNDDGDPVVAAASGVVARVEDLGNTSYGKWIELSHINGYTSRYAHLSKQLVNVGQHVQRGQQIGNVGNTGGSTGPHLHFEEAHNGTTIHVKFDDVEALYFGAKNYTSQNSCNGGVVGHVNTGGGVLTVYADATTTSASVSSLMNGSTVTITCQKQGESISGTYGTSTLWDKVGVGFVSDAYVSTGSDGQVAPTCP